MEPPTEQALRNVVVLDTIFSFLLFNDLKVVRHVNQKWNQVVGGIFRKRCSLQHTSLRSFKLFLHQEGRFPNPNLTVKLLSEVTILGLPPERSILLQALRFKEEWLHRIKAVYMCYWSRADVNRLIPCLLKNMPFLEEIQIDCMYSMERLKQKPLPLYITGVPSGSTMRFPLKSFRVSFSDDRDFNKHPFRPNFLLFCNQLKNFEIDFGGDSRKAFDEFFRLWKPIQTSTMQYENVKLELTRLSTSISAQEMDKFFKETVVEFLKLSRTKALTVCLYSFLNSQVLRNHAASLNRIQKLTLDNIDFSVERWEARGVDIGRIFHDCVRFSGLKELCIEVLVCKAELKKKKEQIQQDRSVKGYFVDLAILGGLQKLKLSVDSTAVSEETALVAFFHGYVPHVSLDMDIRPATWVGPSQNTPVHQLRLSVQEFKDALAVAVSFVDLHNMEDSSASETSEDEEGNDDAGDLAGLVEQENSDEEDWDEESDEDDLADFIVEEAGSSSEEDVGEEGSEEDNEEESSEDDDG